MGNYITTLPSGFSLFEWTNYANDKSFVKEIQEVLLPSYFDTESLLERETQHNKLIYYTRDKNKTLSSFFMTNYDCIDSRIINYMGLLAVRHEYKSQNLTAPVMLLQIKRLREKELQLGHKIQCWGTTASIGSYKAVATFYSNHEPKEDGSYSQEALKFARQIVDNYNLTHEKDNPFVLRNVAKGTRYSAQEAKRIQEIEVKKEFDLFKKFGVIEAYGDRMIILAQSPDDYKFTKWTAKIGLHNNCP